MSPGRLHALVDGVVAIAITLLVLDLPRPRGSSQLSHDLARAWPSYLAYVASFATVGIVWIEHTGMLSSVREVNRRFIERTLVLLFFVSVLPWPTALAADYVRAGGTSARAATLLYSATMMLMAASITLGWRYLVRHDELVFEPARSALVAASRRSLLGTLAYLPVLLVTFASPISALVLAALIALYFATSRTAVPELVRRATVDSDDDHRFV